jgi:hypothetical protein
MVCSVGARLILVQTERSYIQHSVLLAPCCSMLVVEVTSEREREEVPKSLMHGDA